MVKPTVLLDYSVHELAAKKLMKEIHDLLLKKQYTEAATKTDEAIVELRMMRTAIKSHSDA